MVEPIPASPVQSVHSRHLGPTHSEVVLGAEQSTTSTLPQMSPRRPDPSTAQEPRNSRRVYRLLRDFQGVTGVQWEFEDDQPAASNDMVVSLGTRAETYMYAHGYTRHLRSAVVQAYVSSHSIRADFVNQLASKGLALMEAEYLWTVIRE